MLTATRRKSMEKPRGLNPPARHSGKHPMIVLERLATIRRQFPCQSLAMGAAHDHPPRKITQTASRMLAAYCQDLHRPQLLTQLQLSQLAETDSLRRNKKEGYEQMRAYHLSKKPKTGSDEM